MAFTLHKNLLVSIVIGIILSMPIGFLAYAGQIDAPQGKKRIILNDDGNAGFFSGKLDSDESLKAHARRLKDTNTWIFQWGVMIGTTVNYPSKVAGLCGSRLSAEELKQVRDGDRRLIAILSKLAGDGVDSLQSIAKGCHEAGILCYASIRANSCYKRKYLGWPDDLTARMNNDKFWWDHQEYLITDKSGKQQVNLSYAFPEVRELKLAIVREIVKRDVDGVDLDFLRDPPFLGFEKPLIRGFIDKYGVDPRTLPDSDKRWNSYQCDVMTNFMRSMRRIVDQAGTEKKRRLGISVRIDHKEYKNLGLDIEKWMKEGIIDILIVGQYGLGGYAFDLAPFVKMAKGTGCLVFVSEEAATEGSDPRPQEEIDRKAGKVVPKRGKRLSVQDYTDRARNWYRQGATGIHLFNETRLEVIKVVGEQSR